MVDAGHSMGGALAMLLTATARLQLRHPADQLSCQTFGSPPVLAHRGGGGSADVLQVTLRRQRSMDRDPDLREPIE